MAMIMRIRRDARVNLFPKKIAKRYFSSLSGDGYGDGHSLHDGLGDGLGGYSFGRGNGTGFSTYGYGAEEEEN